MLHPTNLELTKERWKGRGVDSGLEDDEHEDVKDVADRGVVEEPAPPYRMISVEHRNVSSSEIRRRWEGRGSGRSNLEGRKEAEHGVGGATLEHKTLKDDGIISSSEVTTIMNISRINFILEMPLIHISRDIIYRSVFKVRNSSFKKKNFIHCMLLIELIVMQVTQY